MKFRHGMVAPLIALFIGVVGFPLIYAFYLSVTDHRLTSRGTPKLVGADNYVATLRDGAFWQAFGTTATVIAAVVPVPDPRVEVLAEMERSRKVVHAQVRVADVPGGATTTPRAPSGWVSGSAISASWRSDEHGAASAGVIGRTIMGSISDHRGRRAPAGPSPGRRPTGSSGHTPR